MEQISLFKIRDKRKKGWFFMDNEYLNGYAKVFGPIGTAIYVSFCRHADSESQKCFPSQRLIAEELNITDRTVRKYIKLFERYKLLAVERERTREGKWLNNTYYLLDRDEWIKPKESMKRKESNVIYKCLICGNNLIEWAHVIPKAKGGKGIFRNRIPLCPNHHTLFDKGELTEEELKRIDDFQNQRKQFPMVDKVNPEETEDKTRGTQRPNKDTHKKDTHKLAKANGNDLKELISYFFELKGWADQSKDFYKENKIIYARFTRPAKDLLKQAQSLEKAKEALDLLKDWATERKLDWMIETAIRKWLELFPSEEDIVIPDYAIKAKEKYEQSKIKT